MNTCRGCLKETKSRGFCQACINLLWKKNKKIIPVLDFDKEKFMSYRLELSDRMSISGVQDKISLKVENGRLIPTAENGEYILKPAPVKNMGFMFELDIPANEQLTMQIASQVFGISTAACGLVEFSSGEYAYITRRFDRRNNVKLQQEDFCQLSNRTPETHGKNFKYDGSYEETGQILKKYCNAYRVEIVKLYKIIIFNYIFSNGDAHMKNFSLIESEYGDYILSPAYDLLSTSIHLPDEDRTALQFFNSFETESYKKNGFYSREDFIKLAELFGINKNIYERYLESIIETREIVLSIIDRSFLSLPAMERYIGLYADRLKTL